MKRVFGASAAVVAFLTFGDPPTPVQAQPASVSDHEISDAYIYLLGRLLVTRQQQLDFQEGFRWNEVRHRKPGAVDWPNPNLDVAYSEAWVAVDETSCTIVTVPKIDDRYYTVQFLNGWGETLANINERLFRAHPNGEFAVCLKGANVQLPTNVTRIDLPVKYSRELARVELGDDWKGAEALQHQFAFKATGTPALPTLPEIPYFTNDKLPGVEAFEKTAEILASEADINKGMVGVQEKVMAVVKAMADTGERAHIDDVIRKRAIPNFLAETRKLGTLKHGWLRPRVAGNYGSDYLMRSVTNMAGIWANTQKEVVYFGAVNVDGNQTFTQTWPADALPSSKAKYFWSVILVDSAEYHVVPNPLNRHLLNKQSGLQFNPDGSLTLAFAPRPPQGVPESNWLPTPPGKRYNLTLRFYGPAKDVADATYYPPPLVQVRR